MVTEPEPIQVHHQPALVVEAAGVQLGEPLGRRIHKPARHRRLRRGLGGLLDVVADGFERDRVAARGDPREHARHDALGQLVGGRERRVGLEWYLTLRGVVACDGAHPRAAHRHAAATQRHAGRLAAVAVHAALGVVAALGADQFGDLGGHQLGQHLQADSRGCREQALAHVRGERGQVAVDAAGQPLRQPMLDGRHQRQRARVERRVARGRGRVRSCHRGPPPDLAVWRSVSHEPLHTEDPHLNFHGPRVNLVRPPA